ncbi:MAG: alpha/beta hydrolase [Pseudomonadota bacterium]
MKTLTSLIGLLVLCYAVFGAVLYTVQRRFIYFPVPAVPHGFETLSFQSGTETLNITLVNGAQAKAVLYFGGNAEAVAHNGSAFETALPDHAVYLVNYRGYGGSTGEPTEAALFADAVRLFDQLAPLHTELTVMGRSLGSGVATHLAAERPVSRLVLVTPFDSILNVARGQFPIYPLSLMLKDHYNSAGRAAEISAEVLVLIAGRDEVIARARSSALVDAFRTAPAVVVFETAGHNDISLQRGYHDAISTFLAGDPR